MGKSAMGKSAMGQHRSSMNERIPAKMNCIAESTVAPRSAPACEPYPAAAIDAPEDMLIKSSAFPR